MFSFENSLSKLGAKSSLLRHRLRRDYGGLGERPDPMIREFLNLMHQFIKPQPLFDPQDKQGVSRPTTDNEQLLESQDRMRSLGVY